MQFDWFLHMRACCSWVVSVQVWLPVLLELVKEAANAVQPAAAAAFGENDPRFYVQVSAPPETLVGSFAQSFLSLTGLHAPLIGVPALYAQELLISRLK
jgi:hypothetical protein